MGTHSTGTEAWRWFLLPKFGKERGAVGAQAPSSAVTSQPWIISLSTENTHRNTSWKWAALDYDQVLSLLRMLTRSECFCARVQCAAVDAVSNTEAMSGCWEWRWVMLSNKWQSIRNGTLAPKWATLPTKHCDTSLSKYFCFFPSFPHSYAHTQKM